MVFALLVRFAEAQREAIDVNGFLAIDAARLDGLREEFVDSIGWLMVDAGVAFLEGPLELFGHLVLGLLDTDMMWTGWLVEGEGSCVRKTGSDGKYKDTKRRRLDTKKG